jgi:hypothetical protein
MRKSKDITKYDIDWQVKRVSLKKLKTIIEKCDNVTNFFNNHLNLADKERVLNYLEGLSMAYKGEDRLYILNVRDELEAVIVDSSIRTSLDFTKFNKVELTDTAKDNMTRAANYLKKGYRHKELIHFLTELLSYLGDNVRLIKLNALVESSYTIENKVSFFF